MTTTAAPTVQPQSRAPLTMAELQASKPMVSPTKGLVGFTWVALKQILLNPFNLGFAILMPILMYLMFGNGQAYSDYSVGNGNVAAQVLVSMTLFGVLVAASSFAANVSLERVQGISRLYALTPLAPAAQLAGRIVAVLGVSLVVIAPTFTVGFFTDASMRFPTWVSSAAMILLATLVAVACGFGFGFAVRSDGAYAAASVVIVLSAFGAGMTIPLDQMGSFFQSAAPWTPLWGASQLALLPLNGWDQFTPQMLANFAIWTGMFGAMALWGLRRDTGR